MQIELNITGSTMTCTDSRHVSLTRSPFFVRVLRAGLASLTLTTIMAIGAYTSEAQSINDQPPAHTVKPPLPLVDINRASIVQLMRVPGINQVFAQRIVSGRPYANKGQLLTRAIVPPQVYEDARKRIIAHHMK